MRTFYLTLILFICGYTAEAADNLRVFSQPEIPSQEVLDRLNLKMMWRAFSPMEGKRDGYHDIQISENQVIAQTRSGTVIVFNSETGEVIWKSHFGKPYQVFFNLAFNDKFVFAVNENDLYALDRRNGNIAWQSSFGISISAPPSVDKHHLYLSGSNGRIYCYALPLFKKNGEFLGYEKSDFFNRITKKAIVDVPDNDAEADALAPAFGAGTSRSRGPQPKIVWEFQTRLILNYPLLVTDEIVSAVGIKGDLVALNKHSDLSHTTLEANQGYSADKPVIVPPSLYESIAYIGSMDACLHSFDLQSGKLLWRYTIGSTVHHRPFVTDNEIFVTAERNGLVKLSRETGLPMWNINYGNRFSPSQEKSDRLIAANSKFLYTLDRSGRMVIIDRNNGAYLTTWDTHEFVFPVVNRTNDRLFLAANNGLLISMRDRDFVKPMLHVKKSIEKGTDSVPTIDAPAPNDNIKKILETKIKEDEGVEKPLQELLDELTKKYNVKFEINKKAFAAMMIDDADKKPVKASAADNIPFAVWLTGIFDPLGITYQPVADTILLFPATKPMKDK
jgi:outer membrane protein assembly factor BamB